ncbi:MAG: toll/interleukin-1 receptor domain-containing protein [Acetobacteraceae bacterium]
MDGFISYAHHDHRLFGEFRTHLRSVERAFGIDFWADTSIHAGSRWDAEIQRRLGVAEVFLLLLSPTFLASDYIWNTELPAIQAREAATPTVLILPVVLEPCYWQLVASKIQAVPLGEDGPKPIIDWKPQKRGHDRARMGIAGAIETFYGRPPVHRFV